MKPEALFKTSTDFLQKMQPANGGILASPPGNRYPYVYPRDHVVCLLALIELGMHDRAKQALDFILTAQLPDGSFPQRYSQEGKDASYKPKQIDGNGMVLVALEKYIRTTKDMAYALAQWERIKSNVAFIESNMQNDHGLVFSENSIHEFPPFEQGYEIWANSVCDAGIKAAARIAEFINKKQHMVAWQELEKRLRKSILTHLWNSRKKSFIKNIRVGASSSVETDVDASAYAVADYGVLKDSDVHVRMTVERIMQELWHPKLGGICRYPKYEGRNNAGWGPWPHFTLMVARHFIRLHDRKESDRLIAWVTNIAYEGMLPEHLSTKEDFEESFTDYQEAGIMRPDRVVMYTNITAHPSFKKGTAYAVLPLTWPHAEFVMTWNLYKKAFHK